MPRKSFKNQRPLKPPCAVIGGGETTVKIDEQFGLGGPNQEFALAAALDIAGFDQVLIAGIDSDGTDGPTDLAGALADGHTVTSRPRRRHRSARLLEESRCHPEPWFSSGMRL